MRSILTAFFFVLALTLPCQAQGEKPKPNTLTPKEIADGWILLFDGETTFGWKTHTQEMLEPSKVVQIKDGSLTFREPFRRENLLTTVPFREFDLSFEYHLDSGRAALTLNDIPSNPPSQELSLRLDKTGAWTSFQIRMEDDSVHFEDLNGKALRSRWPYNCFIGFRCGDGAKDYKIRNIKLRPLNTKSIFNAKDLTDWRVFPGDKYKSKFTVMDGAINVKDGPGDLQTVGKYKDFILQFECISNGKNLNSGIFFRCRDNEYQNGYEAQIRNQFTKEPTQKYLIEEYDPKTNKLLGKKEITSTAFDFGTGAIYRRVPARKEMSKDNEWFGMTIVAQGNHLATWVNGVQVADWFDHRPKTDNARTGCKLDAGHISIQGHDPTTDLSFKNFRIVEFK